MSPQAKYNREIRKCPIIRQIQAERQRISRREKRNLLHELELQCWIWQLELGEHLDHDI